MYRFYYHTDCNTGIDGWKMFGQPDFMPVNGRGLCHDIMEHFPGRHKIDGPQEALALGALIFIRGEIAPWHPAPDVGSMLEDFMFGRIERDFVLTKQPKRRDIHPWIENNGGEEAWAKYVRAAVDAFETGVDPDEAVDDPESFGFPTYDTFALWVTEGYYKASHRYDDRQYAAFCMFEALSKVLGKIKHPSDERGRLEIEFRSKPEIFAKIRHYPLGKHEAPGEYMYWEVGPF